ncbi:MAG: spermine synthase [Gemmatimonadales bacterium]
MIPLLYLLFFVSGAAGLMYESVWARYLGLFVGHEAYAQVLVLVIFLGGMALGAAWVARGADSYRHPLRRYALVEALVGVLGLFFHPAFVATTGWAYDHGLPALGDGMAGWFLQWGLAAALILPQSILLGATFPLVSAGVLRLDPKQPGRSLSWLYFANSFGAAVGVLVGGFMLIAWWGLPGITRAAGVLNLFVAVAVLLLQSGPAMTPQPAPNARYLRTKRPRLEQLLLAAAFFTAVASFCYEIGWIRMLSLVLGSATHSFELMLSAFILGLSLGALWIRRRIDSLKNPLLALATIQILMGALAVATLPAYHASFGWMRTLLSSLTPTSSGYLAFGIGRYGLALLVMFPATFCAGMTLPLITRMLLEQTGSESAVGRVYAFNTFGAILGTGLAALVLLPAIGVQNLLVAGALVDVGVGAMLLGALPKRRGHLVAPAAGALFVVAFVLFPLDRKRLISGVFQQGADWETLGAHYLDFYQDGRTATVSVLRGPDGILSLATNGKTDASLSGQAQRRCDPRSPPRQIADDEITQLLTGLIPLGYLTHEGSAAMVGFGSGISTHVLLASPLIRSVVTVEIEPEMVAGARLFGPANRRAFEDPRSRLVIRDARAYFAAGGPHFDVIVSEPSNPWVSGVSSLFTKEFYRGVRARLAPEGILVQWLQTYQLDDESVLRVLGAIAEVFPDWAVHQAGSADILIVATRATRLPVPDWERVTALPLLQQDLCGVVKLQSPELEATFLADRSLLQPAVRGVGGPNSDFFPYLDLRAERHRFDQERAEGLLHLGADWFNFARQLMNRPAPPVQTFAETFLGLTRSNQRYVQTAQSENAPAGLAPSPAASRARYEWERWQHGLGSAEPPRDWKPWLDDLRAVSSVRHAGTAGWVDERFFRDAEEFAMRHRAPDFVTEVLRFRRAVQAWDANTVLATAERLADAVSAGSGWLSSRELMDAAIIAATVLGRPAEAKAWRERFEGRAGRSAGDLRSRILAGLEERSNTSP